MDIPPVSRRVHRREDAALRSSNPPHRLVRLVEDVREKILACRGRSSGVSAGSRARC